MIAIREAPRYIGEQLARSLVLQGIACGCAAGVSFAYAVEAGFALVFHRIDAVACAVSLVFGLVASLGMRHIRRELDAAAHPRPRPLPVIDVDTDFVSASSRREVSPGFAPSRPAGRTFPPAGS